MWLDAVPDTVQKNYSERHPFFVLIVDYWGKGRHWLSSYCLWRSPKLLRIFVTPQKGSWAIVTVLQGTPSIVCILNLRLFPATFHTFFESCSNDILQNIALKAEKNLSFFFLLMCMCYEVPIFLSRFVQDQKCFVIFKDRQALRPMPTYLPTAFLRIFDSVVFLMIRDCVSCYHIS